MIISTISLTKDLKKKIQANLLVLSYSKAVTVIKLV